MIMVAAARPSGAASILDLPGFVGVQVCMVFSPDPPTSECFSASAAMLRTNNYVDISVRGLLYLGLSDAAGELTSEGDHVFLHFEPNGSYVINRSVDSVALLFGPSPDNDVYAESVAPAPTVSLAGNAPVSALQSMVGPTDYQSAYVVQGNLVFGFQPVPEPGTAGLLGASCVAVAALRARRTTL